MTIAVTECILYEEDNSRRGEEEETVLHKRYFKSNTFKLLIWASLSSLGIQVQDARRSNTNNYRVACFDEDKLVWTATYIFSNNHVFSLQKIIASL